MKHRPSRAAGAAAFCALSLLWTLPAGAQTASPGAMPNGARPPGAAPSADTPATPSAPATPGTTGATRNGLPPAPAELTAPPAKGAVPDPAQRRGADGPAVIAPPATTQSPATRARAREAFDCGRIADRSERTRCVEERDRPASAPR
jgi:hypothetical protein